MKDVNDFEYWENIYLNNDAGWDLGSATPYIEKISDEIKKRESNHFRLWQGI